jgi:hypothetical protein
MTRATRNAVYRAIREKEVGSLKSMSVEAYILGSSGYPPYSDEDTDIGCDSKVPIEDLDVAPGDRIDCYVYGHYGDPEDGGLVTNIEVEFGAGLSIAAVRNTSEVALLAYRPEGR